MLIEHFYGSEVFVRHSTKQVRLEIYLLRVPFDQMDAVDSWTALLTRLARGEVEEDEAEAEDYIDVAEAKEDASEAVEDLKLIWR